MEALPVEEQQNDSVFQKKEEAKQDQINVLDVEVTNENVALNILITFVNLAQKRGAFNLNESAKIWECIKQFQKSSSK
tara:strand:+ start:487 stop:720 length:234 start_codon:yes stop_codon:yes gene_type:complete